MWVWENNTNQWSESVIVTVIRDREYRLGHRHRHPGSQTSDTLATSSGHRFWIFKYLKNYCSNKNNQLYLLSKKTKNIHVMIRSEIRFISRELVEKALLPCVLSNFNLLENRYTEDGLLPIQVYIEVMFFRDHTPNTSDKLLENLFLFLKEGPSTISLLL